ncbi:MAG: type II secretion system F family protein [Deltaproteobacteria bacterium]|nr:type II secretion system F family protein [Deltaproteobacteria bacterium]
MLILASILIGLSVFIISYQFFRMGKGANLPTQAKTAVISESLVLRLTLPIIRIYLLPSIGNLKIDAFRKHKKKLLVQAGLSDSLTADEFLGLKIFLTFLLPLAALAYNLTLKLTHPLWILLIFSSLGWLFPNLWIQNIIKNRERHIRLAIPFVIDLMSLCTEAGLDFMKALQRVVQKAMPSPLIEELQQVLKELQVGNTRAQALRNMADRLSMSEISSLVAVLVTADQMGANISTVLKQQSDQIRVERFIAAEKAGAKASQKILLPTILFIVPAVFIVVLGPILAKLIVQFLKGGINIGGGFL